MKLYLLSTANLTIEEHLDGIAIEFLSTEDSASFRLTLLICTRVGDRPRNARLKELLEALGTTVKDAPSGINDFLSRPADEIWHCFVFDSDSPLRPFTSDEVAVHQAPPPEPVATILDIILRPEEVDDEICRPAALQLNQNPPVPTAPVQQWSYGPYLLAAGQFYFRSLDSFEVHLNLSYAWKWESNGLQNVLKIELAHDRGLSAASRIRFNGREAVPDGNHLPLSQGHVFEFHGISQGGSLELRLARTGSPYKIQWDQAKSLALEFEGNCLEWRVSDSEMTLSAVGEGEVFLLTTELSLVSGFIDGFVLVHPAVNARGESIRPLSVNLQATLSQESVKILATGLNWPASGNSPKWNEKIDDFLRLRVVNTPSSTAVEPARFTTLNSDLSGLLDNPLEGQINGELVGLQTRAAEVEQKLSKLVMLSRCRISKREEGLDEADLEFRAVFNLLEMKVREPMYFRFLASNGADQPRNLDFGFLSVESPSPPASVLDDDTHDGFIALKDGVIVVAPKRGEESIGPMRMLLPGGRRTEDDDYEKRRWLLHLTRQDVRPDFSQPPVLLKIARTGVTVKATLQPKPILLQSKDGPTPLFKDIEAAPVVGGEIQIQDNQVLKGEVQARMLVPGTSDLQATATARLARDSAGKARFSAELRIESESSRPVCELLIGFFNARISRPRLGLAWESGADDSNDGRWKLQAVVDAELAVRANVSLQNGMTELRSFESIVVKDLDLINLTARGAERRPQTAELTTRRFAFSVFGLVGLQLDGVKISWTDGSSVKIRSEKATITFGNIGQTRGGISTGNLDLDCGGSRLKINRISGAAVNLSVPGKFDFHGGVSWNDKAEESHFAISGRLVTFGGLAVEGFLKYGRGIKRNGDSVPMLAAFASRGNLNKVISTVPPLVLQEGGLGAGYNAELGNLSRRPSVNEILQKIDQLEPGKPDNWRFVHDDGTAVTVAGRLVLTSQVAKPETVCGYVLWLVASIDTSHRIIAAGKVWLFSSQSFAMNEKNNSFPSLVAAMSVDLRRPSIVIRAETRQGGAIEEFPQLKEILDRTRAQLTIRLTPELFDIFLERLTYEQRWLGADFEFSASWRFSIFRETVLQYVRASARGRWETSLGGEHGGFKFTLDLDASLGFGGLIGRLGVMTWGGISTTLEASCEAFVEVEFSLPYIKWNGLKSKTAYRTVSERFEMPRQSVPLGVSGEYAFRGTNGKLAAGVRLQVHFNRRFCGQELSMSPEYIVDEELLTEVRNHVRWFEAQLDRVASSNRLKLKVQRQQRRQALTRLRIQALQDFRDGMDILTNSPEEWIVLESSGRGQPRWTVVPCYSTPWLTPERVPLDPDPKNLFAFKFVKDVVSIEIKSNDGIHTIAPVWNHDCWDSKPQEADVQPDDIPFLQLNSLFAESAVDEAVAETERMDRVQWLKINSRESRPIEDLRPLERLREALTDEDRLSLPAQVYPFTYRPHSGGDYEEHARDFADFRSGAARLRQDVTAYRSARGSLLTMLVEELSGRRPNGVFSKDYRGAQKYIREEAFPETAPPVSVSVQRKGQHNATNVRVLRLVLSSNRQVGDYFFEIDARELRRRIDTFRGCQEFRVLSGNSRTQSASAASRTEAGPAEVVVKLPISFGKLFDPIEVGDVELNCKYFELVDHVRVMRRMPFEREFQLVGDRIPLPADIFEQTALLHPFIFTDVLPIPAKLRGDRDRFLDAVQYELVVVPLGWEGRENDEQADLQALTKPFPALEPFVPGSFQLKGDLALLFDFKDGSLVKDGVYSARLAHTTSSTADGELVLDTELQTRDFEIWTEASVLKQDGFYGRTVSSVKEAADGSDTVSRQERMFREASGRELRATRQLTHQKEVESEDGVLTFKESCFEEGKAYRFFIRPSRGSPLAPVRELPVFLVRSAAAEDLVRPFSVPALEPVDLSAADLPSPVNVVTTAVEATNDDRRHRLQIQWDHPPSARVGGVEIEILDTQERRLLSGQRVEVLAESVFREHVRNFSDEAEWSLIGPRPSAHADQPLPAPPANQDEPFPSWFWDRTRWFDPDFAGSAGNHELRELICKLKEFELDVPPAGVHASLRRETLFEAIQDLWNVVAIFLQDPQNDGDAAVQAVNELRCGLLGMYSGLFPSDVSDPKETFQTLEEAYANQRQEILDKSLSSVDDFDQRRDILAARQLVRLVDYRRFYALHAIDDAAGDMPMGTDTDLLNDSLLPEDGLEKSIFQQWLGIELNAADPGGGLGQVRTKFPLSSWFFERMVPWNLEEWEDFHSGRKTAEQLIAQTIPDFQSEVQAYKVLDQNGAAARMKWQTVPYAAPLQRILVQTEELTASRQKRLVMRSHHSLGIAFGDRLEKVPISTSLAGLIPESIRDIDVDLEEGADAVAVAAPTLFPAFLHLLERLGLAVDVALVDSKTGVQSQDELTKYLSAGNTPRIPPSESAGWNFAVVYGRAMDDGSAAPSETRFPFAKLIALPEALITPDEELWKSLLQDRQILTNPQVQAEWKLAFFWWKESVKLIPSKRLGELHLEHRGATWISVPVASNGKCRIQLPVPTLDGQIPNARVRSLSRDHYLAEWLEGGPVAANRGASVFVESDPVEIRPYYPEASAPPAPAAPFGVAGDRRIDFIITHPADEVDSRDNLLTATRTGFKHLGLTFIHQPIALNELENLWLEETGRAAGEICAFDVEAPTRALSCFSNESIVGIEHLPYYMEVALLARSIYDAAGRNVSMLSPDPSKGSPLTFLSRKPGRHATAPIAVDVHTDQEHVVWFTLVRHDDLLTDAEREALPNEWSVQDLPVRCLPDIRTSYLLMYEVAEGIADDPARLSPLFELLLPGCPGYGTVRVGEDHRGARVQKISTAIQVGAGPYPLLYQGDHDDDARFVVGVLVEFGNLDVNKLSVATIRDGRIAVRKIAADCGAVS